MTAPGIPIAPPVLMRGPETLRRYISAFLRMSVPTHIDIARLHWGTDEWQLPYPVTYDVYDPSLVADYPAIGVFVTNDRNHVRNDYTPDAGQEYQATYATKIVVSARTPLLEDGTWLQDEKQSASRLRDDLTSIVRAALLQFPNLGRSDVFMEETTLTTDYLEPVTPNTQSKRWIGSAIISADFRLTEFTVQLPYGTVQTIQETVNKLQP